jgi:hypothetical protein
MLSGSGMKAARTTLVTTAIIATGMSMFVIIALSVVESAAYSMLEMLFSTESLEAYRAFLNIPIEDSGRIFIIIFTLKKVRTDLLTASAFVAFSFTLIENLKVLIVSHDLIAGLPSFEIFYFFSLVFRMYIHLLINITEAMFLYRRSHFRLISIVFIHCSVDYILNYIGRLQASLQEIVNYSIIIYILLAAYLTFICISQDFLRTSKGFYWPRSSH